MDINIRLSLDAPSGWKRRVLLYVVTPVALVAAASALAYAYDTSWIADKKPVSASALKANLDEIQTRLQAIEAGSGKIVVTKNGKKYSIGATYCGTTIATNGQITNGYAGAKDLCEAAPACGTSASAHPCSPEEAVRSASVAIPMPKGWLSTGVAGYYDDCDGWSVNSAGSGAIWDTTRPGTDACTAQNPILCCD